MAFRRVWGRRLTDSVARRAWTSESNRAESNGLCLSPSVRSALLLSHHPSGSDPQGASRCLALLRSGSGPWVAGDFRFDHSVDRTLS